MHWAIESMRLLEKLRPRAKVCNWAFVGRRREAKRWLKHFTESLVAELNALRFPHFLLFPFSSELPGSALNGSLSSMLCSAQQTGHCPHQCSALGTLSLASGSQVAAVLVLCRGGPETDCNSKNCSTPKALFKLVLEEAASLPQVKTSGAFCMDGSEICPVQQSQSAPSALLQSHRFTGLQADDPLVVLRKTPTFPTARADGILWAMWIQAGKWSSAQINRGHDGSWWRGMHQPARDPSANSQRCKRLPKRFKLLLGVWD